jgi:hypothetical protein
MYLSAVFIGVVLALTLAGVVQSCQTSHGTDQGEILHGSVVQ